MDTRYGTLVGSVGGSENPITVKNIAYNTRDGMETEIASVNQMNTVELGDENMTNSVTTGYDNFSSLRSRVPSSPQNSLGGSENPITVAAINT